MNRPILHRIFALLPAVTVACGAAPDPTTFVLTNEGDTDVFHNEGPWLSLRVDGQAAEFNEPSCMNRCGSLAREVACDLAAIYPTVVRLAPTEQSTFDWDGTYYIIPEGKNCFQERTRDRDFVVEFCYSHEFESFEAVEPDPTASVIGGATVKDPTCEEVAFERGGTVDLAAE